MRVALLLAKDGWARVAGSDPGDVDDVSVEGESKCTYPDEKPTHIGCIWCFTAGNTWIEHY